MIDNSKQIAILREQIVKLEEEEEDSIPFDMLKKRKWLERVSFAAGETNEANKEPNKLVLWNGGNGDLYIGICPISHKSTYTHYLRIERSGGASTRNPKVVSLLTDLYRELAKDENIGI